MAIVKNRIVQKGVLETGKFLADLFASIDIDLFIDQSTYALDIFLAGEMQKRNLVSQAKGYKGYPGYSCLSLNDVLVHGVPSSGVIIRHGDLLKIDICAARKGFCADMARLYQIGSTDERKQKLIHCAQSSLDNAIANAQVGNFLGDISFAVQNKVEEAGYDVVKTFCGHGIGRSMHEEPEVPNYGKPKTGLKLRHGMIFAIEPMFTEKKADLVIDADQWTARTRDGFLAVHIEDTVLITDNGPVIATRI